MLALVLLGAGGFSIYEGIKAFGCSSVGFSRKLITCYESGAGVVPGWLAGVGLVLVGLVLVSAGLSFFRRRDY